ncbi:MAG: Mov34/MPN/PAD-1 family protein [Myxococcota bacterium]
MDRETIEVAVVLDRDHQVLFWHRPPDATSVALPDSRTLWDVLWAERERLGGVAHSHPGSGEPWPSREDLTTFAACEAGLGRRLGWWIATADRVARFDWIGPARYAYSGRGPTTAAETAAWLEPLRGWSAR